MEALGVLPRMALLARLREFLTFQLLERSLGPANEGFSHAQREAIVEWQKTARVYEQIQRTLRRKTQPPDLQVDHRVAQILRLLEVAIESGRTPCDLTLYRGVRNLFKTFGSGDPAGLVGREHQMEGYLATSVFEDVARREFTARGGALIVLEVPDGTPVLWVAGSGHPGLSKQGEVLLLEEQVLYVSACVWDRGLPVLSARIV